MNIKQRQELNELLDNLCAESNAVLEAQEDVILAQEAERKARFAVLNFIEQEIECDNRG